MPPVLLPAPAAALVLGALLGFGLDRAGLRAGRLPASLGAWAALAILVASWAVVRTTQDVAGPRLGLGATLGLRLDAIAFAFACALIVPAALLLSLQRRSPDEAARAALAAAGVLLAVQADSLLGAAFWLGAAGLLLLIDLRLEEGGRAELLWPWLTAGWVLLLLAAASLQAIGGTSSYDALPETAVKPAVFAAVGGGALLVSGLLPVLGWPVALWRRPRLQSAGMAIAVLTAAGLYLLTRALDLAGGRYPASWMAPALLVIGLLTTLAAALRAQAARGRREFVAELVPLSGGFVLVGLGTDTQGGLVAALLAALSTGLVAAAAPLLPERGRASTLLAAGLAAGIPPGLGFAARLLVTTAAVEARLLYAALALVLAGSWILALAAAGRAAWLPAARPSDGARAAPALLAGLLLAGGVMLPSLVGAIAIPAADQLHTPTSEPITSVLLAGVSSASGSWPAFSLGLPVAVLALLLAFASRRAWLSPEPPVERAPAPFFALPWVEASSRLGLRVLRFRIPDEYRSLADLKAIERALESGSPFLWLGLLVALAIAVTR